MGNWSVQQEAKKEVKEKERTSRETLGKFFYRLIVRRTDKNLRVSVRSIGIKEKRRNHFDYAVLEINY